MSKRLAPWLWYGLIFATSCTVIHRSALVAAVPAPARPGFDTIWTHAWWVFVKGWHATEFGILYTLFRRSGADTFKALLLVAALAASDEFHQTFVPGRGGLVPDVLIDVGGASVAALLLRQRRFAPQPLAA